MAAIPVKLKRVANWRDLLDREIRAARARTFKWGTFDCCLFVCDCITVMTGVDPGELFRGSYSDEEGAGRAMKSFAGGGLEELVVAIAESIAALQVLPTYALPGDVVQAINQDNQPTIGVVDLSGRFAVFASPSGLVSAPMRLWGRAWRIG